MSGRDGRSPGAEAAMTVRVSCPYCNTRFTLPDLPPSGRVACPRCGDSFPVRGRVEEMEAGGPGDPPLPPQHSAVGTHHSALKARRSVGRATAIALVMGLAGLGIGLAVVYLRGGFRHSPSPGPEPETATAATPPVELRGLGYLPPGANVVCAVQPGPVLAYAARTNQDPRDLLTRAGLPATVLAALDRLGVTLQQIDHLAAGALIPDTDLREFRLAVALVLRHPLADEARFLDQLKTQRVTQDGKTRYKVELAGLSWWLARASDTAWVFCWSEKDAETAEGGTTQLAGGLRDQLGEKLPADAAVWAAADTARWAEKKPVALMLGFAGGKTDWLSLLKKGQAAVAGLTFGDPPRLRVFVRCADAATGEELRAYFAKKATGDGVRHGGAGEWAMLDMPVDPRAGLATIRGFIDDAGK